MTLDMAMGSMSVLTDLNIECPSESADFALNLQNNQLHVL